MARSTDRYVCIGPHKMDVVADNMERSGRKFCERVKLLVTQGKRWRLMQDDPAMVAEVMEQCKRLAALGGEIVPTLWPLNGQVGATRESWFDRPTWEAACEDIYWLEKTFGRFGPLCVDLEANNIPGKPDGVKWFWKYPEPDEVIAMTHAMGPWIATVRAHRGPLYMMPGLTLAPNNLLAEALRGRVVSMDQATYAEDADEREWRFTTLCVRHRRAGIRYCPMYMLKDWTGGPAGSGGKALFLYPKELDVLGQEPLEGLVK